MTQLATNNREWLRAKLDEAGLLPGLQALAAHVAAGGDRKPSPWAYDWAKGYSYGHNIGGLRNGRLRHFANAYADICEEARYPLALAPFFRAWEAGVTFEGSAGEHWHVAWTSST